MFALPEKTFQNILVQFCMKVKFESLFCMFAYVYFQASFTLTNPGMYSIHFSAFDKAGNYKTGRGLFLFDDISVVDKQGDNPKCATASKDTLYKWVVQDTNIVKIVWPDRYSNVRHKQNMWLNKVNTFAPPDVSIYEDIYGNRTNVAIKNVHGRFSKQYD